MPMLVVRLRARARLLLGASRLPEVYGVSYPKRGRTWLRAMIGRVLCQRTGLPVSDVLDTRLLTAAAGLPVMSWHHGGSSLGNPCPSYEELAFDRGRFAGKSLVFLMREPRDTLVSAFFQATKRIRSFDGTVNAFVRSDQRGILKWIAYHNTWHAHRNALRSFHLVRYEALHTDPVGTLRGVLDAIGLDDVREDELTDAVDFARFGRLRNLESSARVCAATLRPGDEVDPESYKVRKGRVGGYGEFLDESDLAYIADALQRVACPFYLKHNGQPLSPAQA